MASPDKTPLEERLEAHYNGRYPEGMEELLAEVVRLREALLITRDFLNAEGYETKNLDVLVASPDKPPEHG